MRTIALIRLLLLCMPLPIWQGCTTATEANQKEANLSATGDVTTPHSPRYTSHPNITATLFWIGEAADADNNHITNIESAWDDNWLQHYGGLDTPRRTTLFPRDFTPKENPFYCALPYNDFDDNGNRRTDAIQRVPWASEKRWDENESIVKNRWVAITDQNRTLYAQWEDAGPFVYDDADYVFGTRYPRNRRNRQAGIDLSPACWIYLGYDTRAMDNDIRVTWYFVDANEVPEGPWKKIVTTRQISWK